MDTVVQRIAELERRCAAAERTNRHWRSVALAVLTAGAAAVGCGAQGSGKGAEKAAPAVFKKIECESIVLKKDGDVMGEITAYKTGGDIRLNDANDTRMELGVASNGLSRMNIQGPNGVVQFHVSVTPKGLATQLLTDKSFGRQVRTSIDEKGSISGTLRYGDTTRNLFSVDR